MSAIAMGLLKKGYSISGSDLVKNSETNKLEKLGAIIFYTMSKLFIFLFNRGAYNKINQFVVKF